MKLIIRPEKSSDYEAIDRVCDLAFKQEGEGKLVRAIRSNPKFIKELSIVALVEDKVVGHVLFFPVEIRSDNNTFESLSLAPIAVLPEYQKQGIGKALIEFGLKQAKELAYKSAIVLGHDKYYPKFGFKRASLWKIKAPIEVPDEAFMAMELVENGLKEVSGTVIFPKEYDVAL